MNILERRRYSKEIDTSARMSRDQKGSYWPVPKLRSLGATIRGPG